MHRTDFALDDAQYGGTDSMGAGCASPCGRDIAVRVRPHMGVHEGWIISCGMAMRHGGDIPPSDAHPVRAFLFASGAGQ